MIDADKLKVNFPKDSDWEYPVNTNQYVSELIDEQPTVDAIPIEWINHYMDTRLTKGTLFYSCMSEFMRDWQKEQEKQNEK